MAFTIEEFSERDFAWLHDYMQPLWHETYGEILPQSQIDFLVEKFFSDEGLRHYRAEGYQYRKILNTGTLCGVFVYVDRENERYMDKLYLLPTARGKNLPALVFSYLASRGTDVTLSVNQRNARALKCYLKNGFEIEREAEIALGNAMINRDYILRKKKK